MDAIMQAFASVFTPLNLGGVIFGTFMGIVIGALPGLSVNMGIALLFPLTFSFQGVGGILMLLGIYCGAIYGGSISAILLNTPGTPASAATTLEGYPMAVRHGKPGRALGLSTYASLFGGVFSAICLMLLAPKLASVAVQFSKPEYFALAVFGISIITSVSGKSVIKGLMGGLVGLFIATIGIDSMSGKIRFTGGTSYLLGGLSFIPVLIGLFAFSQVLLTVEESFHESKKMEKVKIDRVFPTFADLKGTFISTFRSSVIGTFIGCVPGTGGDIASFIAYDQSKKWSKKKDNFGNGEPEGLVAPEAAKNAVSGGALIPMLTLGIPGDGATAIMLGALMVQGLQPGPLLFVEQAPQVYAIFLGLFIANIIMGLFGFSLIRVFTQVMNIPKNILVSVIFVFTFVGAYAYNNSIIDVFVMVAFGFLGYFINKLEFSNSAIVIGIILGSLAETNFRGSLMMSAGKFSIFVTHPVCLVFLLISAASLLAPILGPALKKLPVLQKKGIGDQQKEA